MLKKNIFTLSLAFSFFLMSHLAFSQQAPAGKPESYLDLTWKKVASQMPADWYGTPEAKAVAENVLFAQQNIGGWAKNKPYHHPFTPADRAAILKLKPEPGATIDNGATIMEMTFLAKVYDKQNDTRYRESFVKGLKYLLEAQYPNGGWPQYYPARSSKSVAYASHITFNDNAMVNVLNLLRDVYEEQPQFGPLQIGQALRDRSQKAYNQGIDCILKTQIRVKGQPTVWCAQHDEKTLLPANARAYELASFSGSESVGITQFLMNIKNPTPAIKQAVTGAVTWFEKNKIEGIKVQAVTNAEGKKDLLVVADKNAPALWARFYDLESGKPFFCDRDGIKKSTLAEVGYERRNGYGWYTDTPRKVLDKYQDWVKKWGGK